MERIYGCLYVHFEANLDFTRNEQIGCSKTFQGNANSVKHPHNVTSHVGTHRNVLGENMFRPEEIKKCSKNIQKSKVIIHALGLSQGSSSDRHGMAPRAMGGHWKGVMWFGTNMWMPLRLFLRQY